MSIQNCVPRQKYVTVILDSVKINSGTRSYVHSWKLYAFCT